MKVGRGPRMPKGATAYAARDSGSKISALQVPEMTWSHEAWNPVWLAASSHVLERLSMASDCNEPRKCGIDASVLAKTIAAARDVKLRRLVEPSDKPRPLFSALLCLWTLVLRRVYFLLLVGNPPDSRLVPLKLLNSRL